MSQSEAHAAEWKNRDRYAEMLDSGMTPDEIHEEISSEFPEVSLSEFRTYLSRCQFDGVGGRWSPDQSVPMRLSSGVEVSFPLPEELLDSPEFPRKVEHGVPISFHPIIDTTKTGTKFGIRAIPCDYPETDDPDAFDDDYEGAKIHTRWSNERKAFNVGARSMELRLRRRISHVMGLSGMFARYDPGTAKLQMKGESEVVEDGILSGIDSSPTFGDDGSAEVDTESSGRSEVSADLTVEDGGLTVHMSPAPPVWTPSSVSDPLAEGSASDPPEAEDGELLEPKEIHIGRGWDRKELWEKVDSDLTYSEAVEKYADDDDDVIGDMVKPYKHPWNVHSHQLVFPTSYASAYGIEDGDEIHQHYGAVEIDGHRQLAIIYRFDEDADDVPSVRSTIYGQQKNDEVDTTNYVTTPDRVLLHSLGILVEESIDDDASAMVYPGENYMALVPNPDL
ncbi:hypothetical protein [Halorubrum sp. Atlit-26R]|jgi:hypothetical protein|uniref:hypothetical protein n=1 Tax=Halorubrum sp. Atlit-26R TaxID=2282128 RepID=UPI000EF1AD0C|nr:hypothetical protein [Halorubrum sp. Atlit-26R]RLM68531.1 hypothetical protein DVK07_10440 [Halorubrum sp. Atlit-26R]